MAKSLNKVILIGNLGRDPEVRRLNNGELVVNLSIATSETWRDKASGERKERTEWHKLCNNTWHNCINCVGACKCLPWIFLSCLK